MRKSKTVLLLLSALMASCVSAETPSTDAIKKLVEPRLGANVKVDSVKETPYAGLYEVRIGNDILYTDKTGTYLFSGHVFNLTTSTDLTKERLEEINKIKFSDLPLDKAIKTVKGDGKRVIAVFEDPNCGYCKRFRQTTLKETDNITVYTFMYNILADDSFTKSKNIWCAPDRSKAWDDWMVNNKAAPAAAEACQSPNQDVLELGHKLGVSGTPAIFFADGTRVPGAIDTKALEEKFAKIKQ
ncbi:DsbC family protein [Duganella sp. BJB488]|uniref:Thiol:disulfide interchange protein n=1 Tax=Duganella vulcania TaxID=2692166 RepID=A0A845G6G1_9BURK|nr:MULTISPECIES: DsbC family protein [Duganella]MYM89052.1 thioredoxin fold domain-containing protein [Duganella vulcania]NVD72342.1 DsbC family protein [Duganella sp. BJB1802]RFP08831.1 DsbC family protein [Duganella sp. BJB489]RFP11549.1 DsbC family protein [Duganella sp. BJB488]RFP28560.1 DsbC family protein [Duganella sp. BJB480]